jgi:hypothetical protein
MIRDSITIRTSIHPPVIRFLLMRGSILGLLGAIILLLGGSLLPAENLQHWGWFILLVGVGLITMGLLPYRKIKRVESKPNKLIMDTESLHYVVRDKTVCTIPLASIAEMQYRPSRHHYGIKILLKKPLPSRVRFYNSHFNVRGWRNRSLRRYGCDLFLPYFSKEALGRLL